MAEIKQSPEAENILELPVSYEERGIRKGFEQGMERGIELGLVKVARKMLRKGIATELIAELTGLSEEKIKSLENKN